MTGAQKTTAEALAAMLPGASYRPDPYSVGGDGDALYGDGSILVWFSRPIRSYRKVVRFDDLGGARIGRDGDVLWMKAAA